MKQKCYYCIHFDVVDFKGAVFCNLHKREVKRGCKFFTREPGSDDDLTMEETRSLYGTKETNT